VTTTTLTEFLTDRIAEDEAEAHVFDWAEPGEYEASDVEASGEYVTIYMAPSRLLAECEAKRRIIEVHLSGDAWCDHCSGGEHRGNPDACPTLRLLALPYADHPDYDETWRP